MKKISILVPCYNEEASLPLLYPELKKLMDKTTNYQWEILFINDGSKDKTLQILKGEFYQFNLSSCIRQQNSLTAQFVSFSLANLANIFYPPPIFTIINLCLL